MSVFTKGSSCVHVVQGCCLELMAALPASSVDLVVADLPYGTTDVDGDLMIDPASLWAQYRRILRPSGCVVLFASQPFTSIMTMSNLDWFKYSLVWNKNKCGSPGLAKYRPMKTHEDILIFAPGVTTYNPHMEKGDPYARAGAKKVRCNEHKYGFGLNHAVVNEGTRYPKSILNFSRDFSAQQQVHPHQKPVPLMKWLIETYSNPGDVCLDNAMGSGSTMVACLETANRSGIGFEKSPDRFEVANARLTAAATC